MPDGPRSMDNPALRGIGLTRDRTAQAPGRVLPAVTVVVAADTHWSLAEDIWYEGFPSHLRERAPRVRWYGDFLFVGFDNATDTRTYPQALIDVAKSVDDCPGATDIDARLAAMDDEGVAQEIAFPQRIQGFFHHPDLEVRAWIFRVYNRHLAEMGRAAPGRFFGVGIPNWWNPAEARASIEEISVLGLKTFMIPQSPGRFENGDTIYYAGPEMDPFWSAAEDVGLPLCFHVAEDFSGGGPGYLGTMALQSFGPFRKNLGELIFGGIFDRHPKLRIVFAEAGINWVPGALQDAEIIYDSFLPLLNPLPARRPSEYWHRHCYATFMNDPVGLRLLDHIGADRVLWSTDYPHNESTFGYTGTAMAAVVAATSPDLARDILGGTARKLFALG